MRLTPTRHPHPQPLSLSQGEGRTSGVARVKIAVTTPDLARGVVRTAPPRAERISVNLPLSAGSEEGRLVVLVR